VIAGFSSIFTALRSDYCLLEPDFFLSVLFDEGLTSTPLVAFGFAGCLGGFSR